MSRWWCSCRAKHGTKIGLEANRRGIEMPELCARTLEAMCRDDLFAAVLDERSGGATDGIAPTSIRER